MDGLVVEILREFLKHFQRGLSVDHIIYSGLYSESNEAHLFPTVWPKHHPLSLPSRASHRLSPLSWPCCPVSCLPLRLSPTLLTSVRRAGRTRRRCTAAGLHDMATAAATTTAVPFHLFSIDFFFFFRLAKVLARPSAARETA